MNKRKTWAEELDEWLTTAPCTATAFALSLGFSKQHLSMLRGGSRKPSDERMDAIQKATKGKVKARCRACGRRS